MMELGKVAVFAGPDGETKSVKVSPKYISALLGHAGNRSIPIHRTHEWFSRQGKENADSAELDARIGASKQFRRNELGNLVGDAVFKKGRDWDDAVFAARNNPEDLMFSVVFNYSPDDPECMPLNFRAADLVPCGAATTALFSADTQTQKTSMDIQELLTALDDPAVKAAVKAILKSHTGPGEDDPADTAPAAEMEAATGVTDADKKPEDDKKPAMLRAFIRTGRSIARQTKDLATNETAILAKAKIQAGAEATALLGSGKFPGTGTGTGTGEDTVTAKLAGYIATGAKNKGVAIMRFAKDFPQEYNAAVAAGKL